MSSSPPWKYLFQGHISALKPPTFALATTTTSAAPFNPTFSSANDTSARITPRCRTLVYRGFLGSIPPNPHNPLSELNPPVYASHALTFTTDSRMTKTGEIHCGRSGGDASIGTCGGAWVEAMFWSPASRNQWRFRGKAYLLAEQDVESSEAVIKALERTMVKTGNSEGWSWKKEVQMHFGNMTPALRGSFANPPPGVPLAGGFDEERSGGSERLVKAPEIPNEDILNGDGVAEIARRNFRVGVIVPEAVERLDLGNEEGRARRWVYWMSDGEDSVNGWAVQETWP